MEDEKSRRKVWLRFLKFISLFIFILAFPINVVLIGLTIIFLILRRIYIYIAFGKSMFKFRNDFKEIAEGIRKNSKEKSVSSEPYYSDDALNTIVLIKKIQQEEKTKSLTKEELFKRPLYIDYPEEQYCFRIDENNKPFAKMYTGDEYETTPLDSVMGEAFIEGVEITKEEYDAK